MKRLCTILLSLALTSPLTALTYPRYDNTANRLLEAEAALMENGDTPEATRRQAAGDSPGNQDYWTGKKPLPAGRVGDLLHLSMAAGFTTYDSWLTSPDGRVIVFIAEPGCGASNTVFTVFRLNHRNEYERVGEFNFVTRFLQFIRTETEVNHNELSVVYADPANQLRVQKRFNLHQQQESCRVLAEPEERNNPGNRDRAPWGDAFFHWNLHQMQPRHELGRMLAEAQKICLDSDYLPAQLMRAYTETACAGIWEQKRPVSAREIIPLYQAAREAGYQHWIADTRGDTFIIIREMQSGCHSYTLEVYRAVPGEERNRWQYAGQYHICSRFLAWDIARTRFDNDGFYVELVFDKGQHRKGHKFLYAQPGSFRYMTEHEDAARLGI